MKKKIIKKKNEKFSKRKLELISKHMDKYWQSINGKNVFEIGDECHICTAFYIRRKNTGFLDACSKCPLAENKAGIVGFPCEASKTYISPWTRYLSSVEDLKKRYNELKKILLKSGIEIYEE